MKAKKEHGLVHISDQIIAEMQASVTVKRDEIAVVAEEEKQKKRPHDSRWQRTNVQSSDAAFDDSPRPLLQIECSQCCRYHSTSRHVLACLAKPSTLPRI